MSILRLLWLPRLRGPIHTTNFRQRVSLSGAYIATLDPAQILRLHLAATCPRATVRELTCSLVFFHLAYPVTLGAEGRDSQLASLR